MDKEKKFTLPKGPTIAGTAVIAFLVGGIVFGYLGYYVTKNFIFPCPICVSEQCVECEVCEECNCPDCSVAKAENQNPQVDIKTYKYIYTVEVTSYEPDANNYLGFRYCDNALSTCTVHGVPVEKVAKATMGEKFLLKYNDINIGKDGAAAGTRYVDLVGDFYLKPV